MTICELISLSKKNTHTHICSQIFTRIVALVVVVSSTNWHTARTTVLKTENREYKRIVDWQWYSQATIHPHKHIYICICMYTRLEPNKYFFTMPCIVDNFQQVRRRLIIKQQHRQRQHQQEEQELNNTTLDLKFKHKKNRNINKIFSKCFRDCIQKITRKSIIYELPNTLSSLFPLYTLVMWQKKFIGFIHKCTYMHINTNVKFVSHYTTVSLQFIIITQGQRECSQQYYAKLNEAFYTK